MCPLLAMAWTRCAKVGCVIDNSVNLEDPSKHRHPVMQRRGCSTCWREASLEASVAAVTDSLRLTVMLRCG